MTSCKQIEVQSEDGTPEKWCISLSEDKFESFLSQGNPIVNKVFGDGSLFSPYLFRKFFDPSDAFPLWEFESDILLSHLRSSGQPAIDWSQTDKEYILKAALPGVGKNSVQVYVENMKVLEISGVWRQQNEQHKTKEWRSGQWWEHGYVRRLELPENADWRRIEATVNDEICLEIRIPKCENPHGNEEGAAESKV